MTNGRLPQAPARERTRTGRGPLDWAVAPTSAGALIDAVRMKAKGRVILPADMAFDDFTASIAGRLFRSPSTPGSRYISDLAPHYTLNGQLTINSRGRECPFEILLHLNPTRTLHRALDIAGGRPLAALAPRTFFTAVEALTQRSPEFSGVPSPEPTLDGNDNILPTVEHMGGTWASRSAAFQAEFLSIFETKLRGFLLDAFTPVAMEPIFSDDYCRATREDGVRVELQWQRLIVQRAEIYWERDTPDAPAVVRRMSDAGLALARNIRATTYADDQALLILDQEGAGYPALSIPLTGARTVLLSVYAKTRQRLRTEVRYMHDLNATLRECRSGTNRLSALLERLKDDAARRLPWNQLARLAALPPQVEAADIAGLVSQIARAAKSNHAAFDEIMRSILFTGGVFADDARIVGSEAIVRRLVRAGVVERLAFQLKERRTGRRYGLKEPFATTRRKMLRGFAPTEGPQI